VSFVLRHALAGEPDKSTVLRIAKQPRDRRKAGGNLAIRDIRVDNQIKEVFAVQKEQVSRMAGNLAFCKNGDLQAPAEVAPRVIGNGELYRKAEVSL